ncbi:unnamed protein product [Auanema sp. JU1783]|nr:unnamed protein product [Auanema sp. JU1783]
MTTHRCHRLEGKVAVVTAATKGIGLAIAIRLAEEGASVVISSRTQDNVDSVVKELKNRGLKVEGTICHVANPHHQKKLIDFTLERFGKIDILINNQGINPAFGSILDVQDSTWDKLFETNVKSGWQLTKLVQPIMEKNGGGSIVFNSSFGGYKPPTGIGAYGVTKTALIGLTKVLAQELASHNIRVNGIAPGIIKTKMSKTLWDGGEEEVIESQGIPLGRLGNTEDCAGAVAYLVSDDASYVTGEMIVISGGIHSRL